MSKKILIIMHSENSTPGKVGEGLQCRGYELDARKPVFGDPLPDTLDEYRAAVVFGGPQSANDDHEAGIKAELDWIEKTALTSNKPVLGICLGAQQIARVLGAKVGPHCDGKVEIGYCPVEPTQQGSSFLDAPMMFYQWHRETFEIPADVVHLAANDTFPGQAFQYNECVYGIEFHPEMTRQMVESWSTDDVGTGRLKLPGAQCHDTQMQGYERYAERSDDWLNGFLDDCFLARPASDSR
jgi:GMP synthase (glutamine-hydrolysing)